MTASRDTILSWEEWSRRDALALADLVRRREVTAPELARQVAVGAGRLEPRLQAVLELFDDAIADPGIDGPERDGRLYGVPIFLKDIGSRLRGRRQESGSRLLAGNVAPDTDPLIRNFLAAGLVPLGRSTTPEFGMSIDTATDYLGHLKVTRNPWSLERTAGGSSGGSAALVAAGITPISMASDGGGSTRIPASFCGLVGLKATRGRVPLPLTQNEYTWRIAVEGILTRTVRDTAAAYDHLAQIPNGGSFIRLAPPKGSYLAAIELEPGQLRIGLTTGAWGRGGGCDPVVAARTREAARVLEELGHHVTELDDGVICDWETLWAAYVTQWIMGRAQFRTIARDRGVAPADLRAYLGPMVWRHYEVAERYDKFDLWKAMAGNNTVTRAFGRLMERVDLVLAPAVAVRVPAADGPYGLLRDEPLESWLNRLADACRYTMPGNETGLPAIALPVGLDSDGLPVGVQLYGNFAREDLLLQIAAQLERARPDWFNRIPPVHVMRPD